MRLNCGTFLQLVFTFEVGGTVMTPAKYFVCHDGANQGPFDKQDISRKLATGELAPADLLYLNEKDKWITISQHPDFKGSKPTLHALKTDLLVSEETNELKNKPHQWYVLKGKNRFGPFLYLDVIRMLQEKSVFGFDYIWRESFENWKRLAEVEDFQATKIKMLIEADEEIGGVVLRRRHLRFKYECPLVAHDNAQVWKGKTFELSEGGAGVTMENAMILPGHNVYIHFKPGPTSKPFNVLCEVVSKKYSGQVKDKKSTVMYSVKFINIHKQDTEEIKTLKVAA
jgi:hypothetical protein